MRRWRRFLTLAVMVAGAIALAVMLLACAVWAWLYLVMPWCAACRFCPEAQA